MKVGYQVELFFIFYSLATAWFQASRFNYWTAKGVNKTINHPVWGFAYAVFVLNIIALLHNDWNVHWHWLLRHGVEIVLGILIRFLFFTSALNLQRKFPSGRGILYFNPNGKSIIDRLIKTQKRYNYLFAMSCLFFVLLQIFLK